MLQHNVLAKSLDNLKLSTVLLFVELNTTMALAVLTERDFVRVGQSCGCETVQVISNELRSFSVTPCVRRTRHKIPTDRNWKRTR